MSEGKSARHSNADFKSDAEGRSSATDTGACGSIDVLSFIFELLTITVPPRLIWSWH
jgi:hypothetical protein